MKPANHDFIKQDEILVFADYLNLMFAVTSMTHFMKVNPTWEKVLGWTEEELKSRPFFEFMHPDDINPSDQAQHRASGGIDRFRNRYRHRNGHYVWLEWSGRLVDGIGYAIVRDVTDFVEQEQQLKHTASVLMETSDAVFIQDGAGQVISWNRGAEAMFGYSAKEAIGRSVGELVHTDFQAAEHRQRMSQLAKELKSQSFSTICHKKDGSLMEVAATLAPIIGDRGELLGISTIARDITEQVKRTSLFEQTETVANIGGWEVNLERRVVTWTDQTYRIHEVPIGETVTVEEALTYYADWSRPLIRAAVTAAFEKGQTFDLELQLVTRKGKRIWVRAQGRAELISGKPYSVYGTFQDISERKAAEMELQNAHMRLLQSEKMASLGALSASIAHEINNPLAILAGKASILQRLIETDRFEKEVFLKELDRMTATVDRMAKIIKGLRSFSYNEAGDSALISVDVHGVIESVMDICAFRIESLGAEVFVKAPSHRVYVQGSETQLFQVFMNLISNALDAIADAQQKKVTIEIAETTETLIVSVLDSGAGVAPEVKTRIFEPFFTTKGIGRGTGLGLSISRNLVERQGGHLVLESRGGLTCFKVELLKTGPSVKQIEQSSQGVDQGKRSVLVVDDEAELADAVAFFLAEGGFKIDVAYSGAQAMKKLCEDHYDLVLSDYKLGDMMGDRLMAEARKLKPAIRWAFITGHAELLLQQPGFGTESVPVLRKPVDYAELTKTVRSWFTSRS